MRAYAPAIVLAVWAVMAAVGVLLMPVMLVIVALSVVVMVVELRGRYGRRLGQ